MRSHHSNLIKTSSTAEFDSSVPAGDLWQELGTSPAETLIFTAPP